MRTAWSCTRAAELYQVHEAGELPVAPECRQTKASSRVRRASPQRRRTRQHPRRRRQRRESLPPDARPLAAYGGIFVTGSIAWRMIADGYRPDRFDIIGALRAVP